MNFTFKEDIIQLIEEYQKHRVLWDPKDKWHFNKNKKNDAWEDIAKTFAIDAEDAKRKMSSLLGSFRREKAKGRKTVGTGKGAKEVYKSDWFAFKSFDFLMDKNEPRKTISSDEINDGSAEVNEIDVLDESGEFQETIELSEFENTASPSTSSDNTTENLSKSIKGKSNNIQEEASKTFVKPSTPKRKRVKTVEKEDPRLEKAFQILQESIPKEDTTSIYAKYLSEKLNQFDPPTKAVVIHKINGLIFEAEMQKYRMRSPSNWTSSSSSPTSTPPLTHSPGLQYTQPANIHTSSSALQAELNPLFSSIECDYTQSVNTHTYSNNTEELQEFVNLTRLEITKI